MGVVVVILIIAAIGGMTYWNHVNAGRAMTGVDFTVAEQPGSVAAAISAAHCAGAKAAVKSKVMGVKVTPNGDGFAYATKYGDIGQVTVAPAQGGTRVVAASAKLYVGATIKRRPKSLIYSLSFTMTHTLFRMLGVTPGAVRMKRFQNGLERSISKKLVA